MFLFIEKSEWRWKRPTTMSKENMNLPKAPKDLCFSEVDFIQVSAFHSALQFTVKSL